MITAIIGVGNLGRALASHLVAGDELVVLAARDEAHAVGLAHELGPRVEAALVEDAIAAADVRPNDDMKRPTIPDRNPTGMNTARSESVVAKTARPISRVPSTAWRSW